ncbi:hypothetical protein J437_LFUL001791 [Ladona fulva]|uniref:Peptidase S1 domain-containing protein n=1 Tax=Ladona fulva TaxID=123851 RepID=A0A8K0JY58_LADFU|nr:hypothetical protein J437_LFUL001791 [Ladona fulva]
MDNFSLRIPAAWVRLGALKIQDKQLLSASKDGQTHPVIERTPHPGYKEPSKYNDIALLRIGPSLETAANSTLSRSIHPACLQVGERDIYPTKATGWEMQGKGEDLLELLSVKLLIDENDECNKTFGRYVNTYDQLPRGVDDSLLCFGRRGYAEYVACKGDFDGPLQSYYHDRSCLHTLLGVKSFGKVCNTNLPLAVYTPVPYFLDWIEEQVWRDRKY